MAKDDWKKIQVGKMLPGNGQYFHAATDARGNELYMQRNYRWGGKDFKIKFHDGTVKGWDTGENRPRKAPYGRWKWLPWTKID